MKNVTRMLALAVLGALSACGDDATGPTEPEDITYAAATGVNLSQMTKLASGVYVQTLTAGTGTATVTASNRFVADYTGMLPNGSIFDGPRRSPATPVTSQWSAGQMIPGFADGIIGMKVGEKRKIVIPSRLGYADFPPQGSGIPVNSVLVFEVTIVSIS